MKIENLTLGYGNKNVLNNISLTIKPGEFVFLIGISGSGKSTFIKSLIGDLKPKNGTIIDDKGKDIYKFSKKEMGEYRRSIGVVFQDYKLLKSKNVRENIAFAMEVCGYKDQQIINMVPQVLSQVGLIQKKEKFLNEISGGEAQRVAIARALVHDPELIMGDEPTGNLDPNNAIEIMKVFLELNKAGKTIIIATHDEKIVNQLKKRVITFKEGEIISDIKEGEYNL